MGKAIHPLGLGEIQQQRVKQDRLIGDWLAFQALRFIVVLLDRTPLIEMGLRLRPRRKSRLGKINLSEKQQQDGWHVAQDETGYCYAYFREVAAADLP